jgi:hypothetical protein
MLLAARAVLAVRVETYADVRNAPLAQLDGEVSWTAGSCLTALCALLGLTHVPPRRVDRTQCVLAPLALWPALRVLGARYIALWRNTLDADERFWVTT